MSVRTGLWMKWAAVFLLVAVLLGGLVGSAQAVEIVNNGSIPAGQTIDDDVVTGATNVTVDGTINGTLIAGGQTITINGTIKSDAILFANDVVIGEKAVIEGNLFTGGATVILRGKVNGSVFGGGYLLTLYDTATVARNVYMGGYSLDVKGGSTIGRDLNAAGYQVIFGGTVRNLNLAAAAIEISGTVQGDARLDVGSVSSSDTYTYRYFPGAPEIPATIQPGLRVDPGAKIAGKLTYTSSTDQSNSIQSVPGGGIVYQTPVPSQKTTSRQIEERSTGFFLGGGEFFLWGVLRNIVTLLILGALALWLAPVIFQKTVEQLRQRTLASLGVGLLALAAILFAIPVVAIGLFMLGLAFGLVTLGGLSGIIFGVGFAVYGLIIAVFFALFSWAGKLALAYIVGVWVLARIAPQTKPSAFGALALGVVIFALLAAIPVLGFLLSFLVDLAGIGALYYVYRNRKAVVPVIPA